MQSVVSYKQSENMKNRPPINYIVEDGKFKDSREPLQDLVRKEVQEKKKLDAFQP